MKKSNVYDNRIMLTILAILIIVGVLICKIKVAYAGEVIEYEKSFISIEIEKGDTLSSLAETYAKSDAEYEEYILEVMSINNLPNDTIHSGCYLLIPIYTKVSQY